MVEDLTMRSATSTSISAPLSLQSMTNDMEILPSKDPGYFYEPIRQSGISGSHLRLIRISEESTAPGLRHGPQFLA